MKVALFLVGCSLLLPVVARADRALLLPARSERPIAPEDRERLTSALANAVRAAAVEPIPPRDPTPCADLACIAARIDEQATAHAVELVVWHDLGGRVSGVTVSVVLPRGERFSHGVQVPADDELARAVAEATQIAYERSRRGPGPWLQLEGEPHGAAITVDGQASGVLPRKVKVTGGLHRVLVTHPGYEPFDETVTVPRNPDALKRVPVRLRPLASEPPAHAGVAPVTSPWNYAIAGTAIAAGALVSIGPLRSAFKDGECGRRDGERCTGVIAFGSGQALQLAGAGLLVAAGVAFGLWSPLTIEAGNDHALAVMAQRF